MTAIKNAFIDEVNNRFVGNVLAIVDPFDVRGEFFQKIPTICESLDKLSILQAMARQTYDVDTLHVDRDLKHEIFEVRKINKRALGKIDDKQYIYEDVSKYPSVNLDYTITVKNNTLYNDVEEILDRFSDDLIIKRSLKDIYDTGENKNITISYIVGSKDHTLSNDELANFKNKFISYVRGHNLNINE